MRTLSATLLSLALVLVTPSVARADEAADESSASAVRQSGGLLDRSSQSRDQMFSVFASPTWFLGFGIGVGARYTLPIVNEGFIPALNDSVELEFGGDASMGGWAGYSYTTFTPAAEARWTFHITDQFSAYGKLGLGWTFAFANDSTFGSTYGVGWLYWMAGPGVLYKLNDSIALRAEISNYGLRAGVGFAF